MELGDHRPLRRRNRPLASAPLIIALACVSRHLPVIAAEPAASSAAELRGFLQQYCAACHGPEVHERGLRFDKLSGNLADKDTAATWTKVLDRVTRREMPPKDEAQPPPAVAAQFTRTLQARLQQVSLAAQQRNGRVVLRRLNRTEYETTLRDLLGQQVDVKELLPEDNIVAGFDNVSAALDVSSVHLLRYQEAAEKAILSVVPSRPPTVIKERHTGRMVTEKMRAFQEFIGKSMRLDGDALIMFVRSYGHIPCATATAPQTGRYRIRASLRAVGTEPDERLPVMLSCREAYGRDDHDVRMIRDVTSQASRVIEEDLELRARQMIVFNGWSLPTEREFANRTKDQKPADYRGPGLAVEWVEIEGPLDPFPSRGYQRLFGDVPLKARSVVKAEAEGRPVPKQVGERPIGQWIYDPLTIAPTNPRADAERLLRDFLPSAFRRPVDDELVAYFVRVAHDQLDQKKTFLEAMTAAYKAVFCSPHFLYLAEPLAAAAAPTADSPPNRLDNYAIASRLSYFLWSTLPDAELLRLAAEKKLSQPPVLRAQVDRMLADSRGQRFAENFAGQWLDLRNINATSPDPQAYSEFDDFLFWSMPRETQAFFDEVLRHDLPLTNFVDSSWTILNQRLAQHYGIAKVSGGELRKVSLPPGSHRGGVLTHASVLKVTADGTRTSPVLRGKWVLERILGQTPPPPPPDVPAIEPDIRGATTIRQQLARHRNTAACATCHVHIDPPGFALESFDVIGGWRDFYRASRPARDNQPVALANYPNKRVYRGPDVELGDNLPDGRSFRDIDEYKRLLLTDSDQLARNLAEKLIIFSTGAEIQFADRETIDQLVALCREKKYGLRSLLHEVVQSRIFLNK